MHNLMTARSCASSATSTARGSAPIAAPPLPSKILRPAMRSSIPKDGCGRNAAGDHCCNAALPGWRAKMAAERGKLCAAGPSRCWENQADLALTDFEQGKPLASQGEIPPCRELSREWSSPRKAGALTGNYPAERVRTAACW